jgi:stress-induced-phosphoprotein 1
MAASDAEGIKARADAAFRAGNSAEAVGLYGEALARGAAAPAAHVLHANRSTAALRAGDAPLAVTDALACLRLDASYVKGYYRLGAALLKAGWTELALEAFLAGKERCGGSTEMNSGINEVRPPHARQAAALRARADRQRVRACVLRAARRLRRA